MGIIYGYRPPRKPSEMYLAQSKRIDNAFNLFLIDMWLSGKMEYSELYDKIRIREG